MSLLTELMERPLDPSYSAAADRREAAGLARSTGLRSPLVLCAAILIGFLFVVAAHALRPPGTTQSRQKEALIEQVRARQSAGDRAQDQADELRSEISNYQQLALGTEQGALTQELSGLEVLSGDVAATGPGLTLTVDDAASSKSADGSSPRDSTGFTEGRVTSFDLQVLTNGLWQSGAEAIAINGVRLTGTTAIRFAGQAVLVDYRPLSPPYTITAIGDPQSIQTGFTAAASGAYLKALTDNFEIPSTWSTEQSVTLPRGTTSSLEFATHPPAGATGSGDQTGSSQQTTSPPTGATP